MTIWSESRERLRALLFRSRDEREMEEELEFHLEMEAMKYRREGMGSDESRRRARVGFGGMEGVKEELRDARGVRPLENLLSDVQFALRHFRRIPIVTATVVFVLMLGIGANTALFTVVQSAITLPAPGIPRDDALVRIRGIEHNARFGGVVGRRDMSYPEFLQLAEHRELFRSVAAWSESRAELDPGTSDGSVVTGRVTYVTDSYFTTLGIAPVAGTGLPAGGDMADGSLASIGLISHGLWNRYYGSSPDAIGKTIRVNQASITIVGVAPPRFSGVNGGPEPGVWLPLAARALVEGAAASTPISYDSTFFSVVARLQSSVEGGDAIPVVQAIAARAAAQTTRYQQDAAVTVSADVVPLLADNYSPSSRGYLAAAAPLAALSLLILLITCMNVSGLLIGVGGARRSEIAVRLSLGATRGRIIRQLVAESVVLSTTAGALDMALLWVLIKTFEARITELQLALDFRVAAFALAFATLTGILVGLAPAFHATRVSIAEVLKDSAAAISGFRSSLQRAFVVAQIALTQPFLVGLGALLLIIFASIGGRASPAHYANIVSLEFDLFASGASVEQRRVEIDRLLERLASLPGVIAAVPQQAGYAVSSWVVYPADRAAESQHADEFRLITQYAPPGYFDLMGIPIVHGRDFTASETHSDATSVIVGSDLAHTLWGELNPVGRRLEHATRPGEYIVVGVVDERSAGMSLMKGNDPLVYRPTVPGIPAVILARASGPAAGLLPSIRSVVSEEAQGTSISRLTTLDVLEAEVRGNVTRMAAAASAGGLLALFLSAIGLYSVISYAVGRRAREIGIRTALGAQRTEVVWLFLASGLRLGLVGIAIGLPLGLFALHLMLRQTGMPQVSPLALAALIAAFVLAITAIATWIPARRAAAVDSMAVLRNA